MAIEPVHIPGTDFAPRTLVDLLRLRARTQTERVAYTFLSAGESGAEDERANVSLTYGELDERVRAVAATLQSAGAEGRRAMLFCPPGLDYVVAFFGCLYAGVVAVPAYPPRLNRNVKRLEAIAADAQAEFALSVAPLLARAQNSSAIHGLEHLRWLAVDELTRDAAGAWREVSAGDDELAYLQYTSGSTATPKGVMISHANVLHNSAYIHEGFGHTPASVALSWLPHFHDMGLLDGIIQPLYGGFHGLLMSPAAFLQRPLGWLEAITRYGVTHSGGPNFAYELCVRRVSPGACDELDLSRWAVAYNGAEPVRAETLERFSEAFASSGFRRSSFYPAYGLAEATLKVSGGKRGDAPVVLHVDRNALAQNRVEPRVAGDASARALVGVGGVGSGTEVVIVNPETMRRCAPGEVGEIWVAGPGVARGYWRRAEETTQTFGARLADTGDARLFLRTGDLGFLGQHGGAELFVTGRLKDLIIVRGRNLYPQDLELTAERSHAALRAGGGAAFAVEVGGEDRLVLVQEVEQRERPNVEEVVGEIRRRIAEEHEVSAYAVMLIKAGSLPKTSSGKVQRRACRAQFLAGELDIVGEWREEAMTDAAPPAPGEASQPDSLHVGDWLAERVCARLGIAGHRFDAALPLTRLGLDSLSLTELAHDIEVHCGVSVPVSSLLDDASVASLAKLIEARQRGGDEHFASTLASPGGHAAREMVAPLEGSEGQTEYPLSRGQQALWFLQQLAPESAAYHVARAIRIGSVVSVATFEQAWQRLVERHEGLRTTFAVVNGSTVQRVSRHSAVCFTHVDARVWDESELRRRLDEAAHAPFDLEAGPLLRVGLFTRQDDEHILLLVLHHIITDLRSLALLLEEFAEIYEALLRREREPGRRPAPARYADFVEWQENWLRGEEAERQWRYWSERLSDAPPPLDLLTNRPRPLTKTYDGATHRFTLDSGLSQSLRELARSEGVTLYVLLLGAFQLLLWRHSGQEEILTGSATSGRNSARFADVLNYFVNPVVLRQSFDPHETFAEFLRRVREVALGALAHQDYPFQLLVDRLHPQRDPGRSPLFDVMFNWQQGRHPAGAEGLAALALGIGGGRMRLGGLPSESYALPLRAAQFDLTLNMVEVEGGEIAAVFEYSRDLSDAPTARRLARRLTCLLRGMVDSPRARVSELPLLTRAEQRLLLEGYSADDPSTPPTGCLHELFAAQAARTPHAVALVCDRRTLTYAELDRRAHALAQQLCALGVGVESRVALLLPRDETLVVALLGVLKAGAAYVPLDERYPRARLAFMLEDAGCAVVLTDERLREAVPETGARLLCLDEQGALSVAAAGEVGEVREVGEAGEMEETREAGASLSPLAPVAPLAPLSPLAPVASLSPLSSLAPLAPLAPLSPVSPSGGLPPVVPANLAYVIYTSGSTGTPKGVAISHQSACALLSWAHRTFHPHELAGTLFSTSVCFDLSVFELFAPLTSGGKVIIASDALALADLAARDEVTLLNTVPSAMAALARARAVPDSVVAVGLAGEPLSVELAAQVYTATRAERVLNLYGPSEDTTYSTWAEVERGARQVTIGRAVWGTRSYVLTEGMRLTPVGVVGELYLGGAGLARGYLNRAELTAERFVPDPFGTEGGGRLYRTGDLVRYGAGGELEYVGRADQQVKVRGYRIELGEVEAALRAVEGVRECCVGVSEEGAAGRRLVAYVVPEAAGAGQSGEGARVGLRERLREELRERLPEPMTPSVYVFLDALPLTPSGKIDRKALPVPQAMEATDAAEGRSVGARTAGEELIAGVWAELLGVQSVSVRDNFFELGGHSLLATQVVSRVREVLGVELPLRSVFESPTVEGLARRAEELRSVGERRLLPPLRAVEWSDERRRPLSWAQRRLWFLHRMEPESAAYNVAGAVWLKGVLVAGALERALGEVVRRHAVLRSRFVEVGGEPSLVIDAPGAFTLAVEDLSHLSDACEREAAVRAWAEEVGREAFKLEEGGLVRARLGRLRDEEHVLLLVMHHIVSDGWSLGVLLRELGELYAAYAAGEESPLAELAVQYPDYAAWQHRWLSGEALDDQLAYWKERLDGAPPALELPTDRPRPAVKSSRGAQQRVLLSNSLREELRKCSRGGDATLFMTLLAAFQVLLHRYTRQADILVGSPIAGRTRAEIEGLIGFFVNTLVLRADLSDDPTFEQLLAQVRETCLGAYAHQDVPFEKLLEELQPERSLNRTPLFQVMFVLQNEALESFAWPGLTLLPAAVETVTAKFDLTLSMAEVSGGLSATLEYNTDLFDADTARRMLEHFRVLLEGIVADPARRVTQLPLLTEDERRQLLFEWSSSATAETQGACVHELFERQAARTPEAVAVVFGDRRLSYGELNRRANLLAHALRRRGVGADVPVALLMERSTSMLVAALGILKAGGAYVPLEVSAPRARLAFMLEETRAPLIVTQEHLLLSLPDEHGAASVCVDDDKDSWPHGGEGERNPASPVSGDNLAYIIYTSGSTGRPKGVMVRHRSVVNLQAALAGRVYAQHPTPLRVGLNAPLIFDGSVKQLVQLLAGHAVHILSEEVRRDAALLLDYIREQRLHALDITPSQLRVLASEGLGTTDTSLELMLVGGEALDEQTRSLLTGARTRFYNVYGPTECTVDVTACEIETARTAATIGRPLSNVTTYILDQELTPVPVGVPGELYVGGEGVARGYLNRPELTAERFVPDPYGTEAGGRLYRTGDLARYLPDGNLEFIGRVDTQIKLRGYRIELGEVEAALRGAEGVRECAVSIGGSGAMSRLVAYVVPEAGAAGGHELRERLRAELREHLPEQMVPSTYVFLDALPLTPSGKLDRRALPEPEAEHGQSLEGYLAPRDHVEEVLAGIWETLLGLEQIGVRDNFFELGGHSLLATQVMSRVRAAFGVEMPLRALFESPSVEGLARRVAQMQASEAAKVSSSTTTPPPLRALEWSDEHRPLSSAQRRLWFLHRMEPESAAYNVAGAVRLKGVLEVSALERALGEVVRRHAVLRSRFVEVEGEPSLVIDTPGAFMLAVEDLSHLTEASEREMQARVLMDEEARQPFDLAHGAVLRAKLLRLSDREHFFLLTMHHIVTDGWSLGLLVAELNELYRAFVNGRPSPLMPLSLQYTDFARWQRHWLESPALDAQLAYWRERLAGSVLVLELPTDRPRPATPGADGGSVSLRLEAGLVEGLHALARRHDCTLFMLVVAAWKALLSRHAGQEEVSVGTPVAGRTRPEVEGLIGFFVNTLALRTDLSGDPTFTELLGRVREVCLGAYQHQEVPFEQVVEAVRPGRDLGRTPLFQTMVAMHGRAIEGLRLEGVEAERVESGWRAAKFDLTLELGETNGGELEGGIEYRSDLFDAGTVERIGGRLVKLLEGVVADARLRLSELPLLTDDERGLMLRRWNDTARPFSSDRCIHQLFESQADRRPAHLALISDRGQLTYAELESRANQLAHYLREQGVGPGTLIGICMERAPEFVVGVLAILKAGAAYVPMDPAYPSERLAWMLTDCHIPLLLTQKRLADRLPDAAKLFCVDTEWEREVGRRSVERVASTATAEDAAYVIYTSGSTGRPKGILLHHRGLCNLIEASNELFDVDEQSRVLQFSSIGFDVSVWETFMSLVGGATLCLGGENTGFSVTELSERLRRWQVSMALLPPSVLRLLDAEGLEDLRTVVAVGEKCTAENVRRWAVGRNFFNGYGPAEATVTVSAHLTSVDEDRPQGPPIGKPFPNTEYYIVDGRMRVAPLGVAGELCVGGVQLALGYVGRAGLTAEKFVPHPFSDEPGARLYRTGDMARYLADGNVEFLGRVDDQVKLRGFRIEPSEISSVLSQNPAVREAFIQLREDVGGNGDKHLVAYVVFAPGAQATAAELRGHLRDKLPEYMIPSIFVPLEGLPLTANGKLNKAALPRPEFRPAEEIYVAPRTPEEELVAAVWSDLFGVEGIGAQDNFFELGGHSLLAMRVISRLNRDLGVELPVRALFESPTVEGLARAVVERRRQEHALTLPPITRGVDETPRPLSFAQLRLWFLDQLDPQSALYNITSAFRLTGRLSVAALERSLNELARRHESLRTTIRVAGGQPVQLISEAAPLPLSLVELGELCEAEREARMLSLLTAEARRPFDLSQSPLVRCSLLRLGEEEHVLALVMHHIISDGWSLGILFDELQTLYQSYASGDDASPLAELPVQYADYAEWQRRWLRGEALHTQLAYWRERLADAPPSLELPTDHTRPHILSARGDAAAVRLSPALTAKLRALARRHDCTLFMVLMAAWQLLLSRHSHQTDISVGTPVAGRTRPEVEGLIGFFVNTLVLRTDLSGDPTFTELLGRVREVCLGAYQHQEVPFERVVEELVPERSLSRTPLFQTMLLVQSGAAGGLRLEGLKAEPVRCGSGTAKFELTLTLGEGEGGGLEGAIEYSTDLFEGETIERMIGRLSTLLEGVVADDSVPISELPLLTEDERHLLLHIFNQTGQDYPPTGCLHELFAAQAARTPHAVALVCDRRTLTYADLDRRAHALAQQLCALGVGVESRVALLLPRDETLVVALLGVLKAGAAYVPLDERYPRARLAFMLEDAGCAVVLTDERLREAVPETGARLLCVDEQGALSSAATREIEEAGEVREAGEMEETREAGASLSPLAPVAPLAPLSPLAPVASLLPLSPLASHARPVSLSPVMPSAGLPPVAPANLAYVIYTSGSTGTPKGVAISHQSACALLSWAHRTFHPHELAGTLFSTSVCFDLSVFELFAPLTSGGKVIIASDALALADLAARDEVTLLNTVPSAMAALARARAVPDSVVAVGLAGEPLSVELAAQVYAATRAERVLNLYGPSEDTTYSTWAEVERGARQVTIGRAVWGTRSYVLTEGMRLTPVGVVGELYLGGAGLARGYLNRAELTAERFVPDAFGTEGGGRLYRTGDLVRYGAGGELEYVGRADQQVKVRGYRIELGEVEAALRVVEGVRECCVGVSEEAGGGRRLVAYVVPEAGAGQSGEGARVGLRERLREELRERLPEPMTPSVYVFLDALPLTPSGKIDRKALPAPQTAGATEATDAAEGRSIGARTAGEELIAGVWAELLGVRRVGVRDNFFELGGHSLLATQVVSRVREVLGVELPLRSVFESPTIEGLARRAEELRGVGERRLLPPLRAVEWSDERGRPLSSAQRRLWFLHRMEPESAAYNVAGAVRLKGVLVAGALERALGEVVRRHAVLRSRFVEAGGEPSLVIDAPGVFTLSVEDLSHLREASEREAAVRAWAEEIGREAFKLEEGGLVRARLGRLRDEEHVLLLVMHHIVSDGWSLGVLLRELGELYAAYAAGEESPLAELAVQYPDYAAWQHRWLSGGALDEQLAYWRGQLAGAPPLRLPAGDGRFVGATHKLEFLPSLTEELRCLCRREGVTLHMLLLSAFQTLLYSYTGQEEIVVGTPVANRHAPGVENLIGFFVNTLALRTDLGGRPSFREALRRVREVTLDAYAHQDLPFERLVDELRREQRSGDSSLFRAYFNMLNFEDQQLRLPGLETSYLELGTEGIKFDLELLVTDAGQELRGMLGYNSAIFDAAEIESMAQRFRALLESVLADPEREIASVVAPSGEEQAVILDDFNASLEIY